MKPVTFCGRTFRVQEVELMREIAQDYAGLGVSAAVKKCAILAGRRRQWNGYAMAEGGHTTRGDSGG